MKCLGYFKKIPAQFLKYNTSLVAQMVERVCLQCMRPGFYPWVGKIPRRRKWQPTPVFLPAKSHGRRSLAGYSLWGCKESDTTEQLHIHLLQHSNKRALFKKNVISNVSKGILMLVAQSCPSLCTLMNCSPPGSYVYGILQARGLEWVAISFSRGSSQPRDWTLRSYIADGFFTIWVTREAQSYLKYWAIQISFGDFQYYPLE